MKIHFSQKIYKLWMSGLPNFLLAMLWEDQDGSGIKSKIKKVWFPRPGFWENYGIQHMFRNTFRSNGELTLLVHCLY